MLSRARCYSPACLAKILRFIDDEPYIDFQIAHICDAKAGNRYDENMTDDERRSFANLILLCKPHHELVDKRHPERFSSEELRSWKWAREGDAAQALSEIGPVTEETLPDLLLGNSVADTQAQVTSFLQRQEDNARLQVENLRTDFSYERVQQALLAIEEVGLLSAIGIRASAPLTDFYLRLQRSDSQLLIHLDTSTEAGKFSQVWSHKQGFDDVMIELAKQVRPTMYWSGAQQWEFASAVNGIIDVLIAGLNFKANGGFIHSAVQLVGSSWLLSHFEAMGLKYHYQVIYLRLGENDWYAHLSGKSWTNPGEVGEMLDSAAFLSKLASGDLSGGG